MIDGRSWTCRSYGWVFSSEVLHVWVCFNLNSGRWVASQNPYHPQIDKIHIRTWVGNFLIFKQKGSQFLNVLSYKRVLLSKSRFRSNHCRNKVLNSGKNSLKYSKTFQRLETESITPAWAEAFKTLSIIYNLGLGTLTT